jgi:hypothetical protein
MERVTEGVGLVDYNCIGEGQSRDGRMEEIKVVLYHISVFVSRE